MRRRARRDATHGPIVRALTAVGCDVLDLSPMGQAVPGCPDVLVHRAGHLWLGELKSPEGPLGGTSRKGQKLNDAQERFRLRWPVHVWRSVDEALATINRGVIR